MIWPGWGDVLPLFTTLLTTLAAVIGAVVTLARLSNRRVSRAVETVARRSDIAFRKAATGVSAEVKALAGKLATNDFPHMEARIERGLAAARGDREAMEVRLREDREAMETRLREDREAMETRLREDGEAMEVRFGERLARMDGERQAMETRLGGRIERMEERLLAAFQRRPG